MPDPNAAFRRRATVMFRFATVAIVLIAIVLPIVGWRLARWWGLAGGVVAGGIVLVAGLTMAAMLYAFTQDGA